MLIPEACSRTWSDLYLDTRIVRGYKNATKSLLPNTLEAIKALPSYKRQYLTERVIAWQPCTARWWLKEAVIDQFN